MLDNLSLYRFLRSDGVVQYELLENKYYIWIYPWALKDFYDLVGQSFFDDGGVKAQLMMDSVVIDISDLEDCADIDLDRVFDTDY